MKRFTLAVFCSLAPGFAQAASPWDGVWFVDPFHSHSADTTFVISKTKDGMWKYDDGSDCFVFSAAGKARVGFRKDTTISGVGMSDTRFDYVESAFGKETSRVHMELSADDTTLSIHEVETTIAGVEIPSDKTAVRVDKTSGFAGKWKIMADHGQAEAAPPASPPVPQKPAKPAVVIFTSADGTMTWYFPSSGELIRGRVDGRRRPITGPLQPSNLTFTWDKTASPNRIVFTGKFGDHPAGMAIEELSEDGNTLTDTFTVPGSAQSSVFVMHKK